MGGTHFNGLALVKELARTGHDVTILNRGKSAADLPLGIRRLIADRTDPESLRSAIGREEFDCVQDISAYRLEDVRAMTELLRGRVGHYIFASSTVIYAATDRLPIGEDHPVDRSEAQNEYGLNKLLCEDHLIAQHCEHGFPATIAAFSMVFGPHNILPLFQINRILQRIAPHLHHWNKSVFFGIRRLEQDVGWTPEYTFPAPWSRPGSGCGGQGSTARSTSTSRPRMSCCAGSGPEGATLPRGRW